MRDVAYNLQGMMGWQAVGPGEQFVGKSRGMQVLVAGTFSADCQPGNGAFSAYALPAGLFIGGQITNIESTDTGCCLVWPMDSDYSITIIV